MDQVEYWNSKGASIYSEHDKIQFRSALEFLDVIEFSKFKKVADIGSGPGHQAFVMQTRGAHVTCIDYIKPVYNINWRSPNDADDPQFNAIWSHHCLEHIQNPADALIKWRRLLLAGGRLFLTVPEIGHVVSSGHVNNFNLTQLVFLLATCGYDCSEKRFTKSRSHLRADVRKSDIYDPEKQGWITSLPALADFGLFPPSATKAIKERGRFSARDLHFSWNGKNASPNQGCEQALDFVSSTMWG